MHKPKKMKGTYAYIYSNIYIQRFNYLPWWRHPILFIIMSLSGAIFYSSHMELGGMAELAALFTVYHGSAADSGFDREKKDPSGWRQGRTSGWCPPGSWETAGFKAGLGGNQHNLTQSSGFSPEKFSPVKEFLTGPWKRTSFLCPSAPWAFLRSLSGAVSPLEHLINATIITWRPLPVSPTNHGDRSEPSALALLTPGLSSSGMRDLGDHMQRKP